jgi:hypothetical protein
MSSQPTPASPVAPQSDRERGRRAAQVHRRLRLPRSAVRTDRLSRRAAAFTFVSEQRARRVALRVAEGGAALDPLQSRS